MSIFLQADSLSVAQNALAETVPVEKTISIWELLTSGGIAGQMIMIALFIMLFFAIYLYLERLWLLELLQRLTIISCFKLKTIFQMEE